VQPTSETEARLGIAAEIKPVGVFELRWVSVGTADQENQYSASPKRLHRISHNGFLASAGRKDNVARARKLLAAPARPELDDAASLPDLPPCPCCGGRMVIIEIFQRAARAPAPPSLYSCTGTTVS
jgi:hypothetical protein